MKTYTKLVLALVAVLVGVTTILGLTPDSGFISAMCGVAAAKM